MARTRWKPCADLASCFFSFSIERQVELSPEIKQQMQPQLQQPQPTQYYKNQHRRLEDSVTATTTINYERQQRREDASVTSNNTIGDEGQHIFSSLFPIEGSLNPSLNPHNEEARPLNRRRNSQEISQPYNLPDRIDYSDHGIPDYSFNPNRPDYSYHGSIPDCPDYPFEDDHLLDYEEESLLERERWHYHCNAKLHRFESTHRIRQSRHHKQPRINPNRCISTRSHNQQHQKQYQQQQRLAISDQLPPSTPLAHSRPRVAVIHTVDTPSRSSQPVAAARPTRTVGRRHATPPHSTPAATREERELQRAIQASRNEQHASGLTYAQLEELMSRDLTPEDYEMLLRLDSQVKPKTVQKTTLDALQETRLENDVPDSCCVICMCSFDKDQMVKHLPCSHFFHVGCIVPWLQGHSQNCPLCNTVVFPSS